MSSKNTLAHGPNFHLYSEAINDGHVYLELQNMQFEVTNNRILLSIPVPIWEVIRSHPGMSFEYADMTDAELQSFVESEVDERLKRYAEAKDKEKAVASLFGSLIYGLANQPREDQIVAGITHFTIIRAKQWEALQAISEQVQSNK